MVSVKQCTFIIQPLTISECDWSQVFVSVSKLKNLKTVHGYITLFKPMHRLLLKKTVSMRTWRTSNETLDTTWPCSDRLGLASQPAVSLHLLGSHPCCYFCAFAIKDITSANFLKRKKKKKILPRQWLSEQLSVSPKGETEENIKLAALLWTGRGVGGETVLHLSRLSEHLYLYLSYVWLAPVLLHVCKDPFYRAKMILELCA